MRRQTLAVALCVTGIQTANAHQGDRVLLISELTDADLLSIDIHDGRTEEWPEIVGEPTLTDADFKHFGRGTERTLQFRMWLGWNGATSRIYVAIQAADDAYKNLYSSHITNLGGTSREAHDTYIGIGVDGDHSGDDSYFWIPGQDQRQAQAYDIVGVSQGAPPIYLFTNGRYREFALHPPYSDAGGGFFGDQPTVTVTEAYVTAFDDMELESPSASRPSDLQAGRIIGLALKTTDTDVDWNVRLPDTYMLPGRWGWYIFAFDTATGSAGGNADRMNSSWFADALLLPARGDEGPGSDGLPVDAWARIKASFRQDGVGRPGP